MLHKQKLVFLVSLLCVIFATFSTRRVVAQSAGQTLYNGIVLPQPWPPKRTPTQAYQVPYYIANPPPVIPIDVGRQLFVDDFLIQQTTLSRTQHQPLMYPLNPVLAPNSLDTQNLAMPYSDGVWFDPADQTFKIWYFCGYGNMVCYAYSSDGKNWIRPSFKNAVISGTNEVLQIGGQRDSTSVWMDLKDPNPAAKFKLFAYYPPANMLVYFSPDGITWTQQTQYAISSLSDRTTLFFNPFRNVWVDSMRAIVSLPATQNRPAYSARSRFYAESPNLSTWTPPNFTDSFWTGPDEIDQPYASGGAYPDLYNLDAVPYESLIVGLFSWFYPGSVNPNLVELGVGFSRDGFYWVRPTRSSGRNGAFIPASNVSGTWNMGNTQSAGGCFLVVGNELWFYFSGRNGPHGSKVVGSTGLATLRRDGFYSMDAGSTSGVLTTLPVQFSGKYLFVNLKNPQGTFQVRVINSSDGRVLATSLPLTADSTLQQVSWSGLSDLSSLAGRPVQFQFTLTNGELYSFWVTASSSGSSNGYLAAGGPGLPSAIDGGMSSVSTPVISPAGGSFSAPVTVTLSSATSGATIRYTTDGSAPSASSTVYSAPFQVASSATLRAIAMKTGLNDSAISTATFTIGSSNPPDFTISVAPASQAVPAGATASYTITISPLNGFQGSVNLDVKGLPGGASSSLSPPSVAGSGNSQLVVTTSSTTPAGSSTLSITGTSASLSHSTSSTLTVTTASASLSSSFFQPTGTQNLTAQGNSDWAHWGLSSSTSFDHKAGVTSQISNYTVVNGEAGQVASFSGSPVNYTWTDGIPNRTVTATNTGVYISGQNRGLQIRVPADATPRQLTVFMGVFATQAKITVHLSDNSAADNVDTSFASSGSQAGAFTVRYTAASPGQSLTVTILQNTSGGNVNLQSAALQ